MKKIIVFLGLFCWLCPQWVAAQGFAITALRYSQTQFGGSARFQATGGAATALGGDISSAYYNPAGLGFNRKSEFSFSPSLAVIGSEGDYQNNLMTDNKVNPNVNHFGLVLAFPKDGGSNEFKGGAFAITFTRINNFNQNALYSGNNPRSSIAYGLVDQAQGFPPAEVENQFRNGIFDLEVLAINNYVINPIRDNLGRATDTYYADVNRGVFSQRESIRNTGSQNQWNFSYGGNYKDFIYFGAGLGIQTFNYGSQTTFSETQQSVYPIPRGGTLPDSIPPIFLRSLQLTETRNQKGTGFNLNLGVIVRPVDFLRLGVNFTSPTWFSLTTEYSASMKSTFQNYLADDGKLLNTTIEGATLLNTSNVSMITPLRLNGGIAGIIGKHGFLSFDAEYVDFSAASVSAEFNLDASNQAIKTNYTSAFNFRGGGEWRLSKFRARAGAAYYGSPYKVNDRFYKNRFCLTAGIGYYTKKNYFDLTLVQQTSGESRTLYDSSIENPIAGITTNRTNIVLTAGFYF